jgi:hypothetical protein
LLATRSERQAEVTELLQHFDLFREAKRCQPICGFPTHQDASSGISSICIRLIVSNVSFILIPE